MDLNGRHIGSDRLILTSFVPSDATEVLAAQTPSLTRYMAIEPSPTADAFADVLWT